MYLKLVFYFLLTFISPALTLYLSFKEKNLQIRKWVIVSFFTVFGSLIQLSPSNDGAKYIEVVEQYYYSMNFGQFLQGLLNIIRLTPDFYQRGDPYVHIVSYISGGILQNSTFFFIIVSFVYGYFYVSSLLKVFYKYSIKNKTFLIVFIGVALVAWEGIEGVNTVRTWTGAWVLFYAVFNYFETKNIKYLILVALCPMIHFAYFIITIPVWFVVIFGIHKKLYIFLFLFSFSFTFNTAINAVQFIGNSSVLGEGRVSAYDQGQEYYQNEIVKNEKRTWYATLGAKTRYTALFLIIFILLLQGNYLKSMTKLEQYLFSVVLLMVFIANFSSIIPAMKFRTLRNAGIYILALVFLLLADNRFYTVKSFKPIVDLAFGIALVLLSIFLIYKTADIIYFTSVFIFLSPLIPWVFNDFNFSIRELLR